MAMAGNPDELYMFLGEPPPERTRPPPAPRPPPDAVREQAPAPQEAARVLPEVQPRSPSRRAAPEPNPVWPAINPTLLPGFSAQGPQEDLYTFLGEEPPAHRPRAVSAPQLTALERLQVLWRTRQERLARERAGREAAAALGSAATGENVRMLSGGLSQHLVNQGPAVRASDDFQAMAEDGSVLKAAAAPKAGVAAGKQLRLYGAEGSMWYNIAQGRRAHESLAAPEEREDPSCGYAQMMDDSEEPPLPTRSQYELVRSGTSPPAFGRLASPAEGAQGLAAPSTPNGMRKRVQASKQDWYQSMDD